jgi:hypothetical protein
MQVMSLLIKVAEMLQTARGRQDSGRMKPTAQAEMVVVDEPQVCKTDSRPRAWAAIARQTVRMESMMKNSRRQTTTQDLAKINDPLSISISCTWRSSHPFHRRYLALSSACTHGVRKCSLSCIGRRISSIGVNAGPSKRAQLFWPGLATLSSREIIIARSSSPRLIHE